MITVDSVVWRAPGTYSRRMSGHFVIEGYIDAYMTNDTAEFVWRNCGTGRSIADIVDAMTSEFNVTKSVCERDIVAFVTELYHLGYIVAD